MRIFLAHPSPLVKNNYCKPDFFSILLCVQYFISNQAGFLCQPSDTRPSNPSANTSHLRQRLHTGNSNSSICIQKQKQIAHHLHRPYTSKTMVSPDKYCLLKSSCWKRTATIHVLCLSVTKISLHPKP